MVESREDLIKGRDRRINQVLEFNKWVESHGTFTAQINLSVYGTSEHICMSIGGSGAKEVADVAMKMAVEQIDNLQRQLDRK